MKKRTISAIILLLILILSLIINPKIFGLVMGVVSIIGFNEILLIKYNDKIKKLKFIRLLGIISLLLIVFNKTFYKIDISVIILLPLFILSLPIIFYNDKDKYNIEDYFYILGSIYLIGLAFQNIIYLSNSSISKMIFIFIISFITDTYAYIGGLLIGRHKLTEISPKKTIEGSIVGTIMGVIVGSVYYINVIGRISLIDTIILCLILTIVSEIGDLLFSSIKRYYNKKDYSDLIPGHGGILDRFDSVIYVSLCLSILLKII